MKRDKVFYAASVLFLVGALLAVQGNDFSLVCFVVAYLIRPVLMEFGLGVRFADEREQAIHAKSGDVAFIVLIFAAIGYCALRIAHGQRPEDLYELIAVGIAARAVTGLIMTGAYRKAGVMIVRAIGFCLGLFIVMEGGVSLVSVFGVGVAFAVFGLAEYGKKSPRITALILVVAVVVLIGALGLYHFRMVQSTLWLFVILPVTMASACFFLGSREDTDGISPTLRLSVFGSLAACALFIFAALMFFGSREEYHAVTFHQLNIGEISEIQGYPCSGTIDYFDSGKIATCVLARQDTVLGNILPTGSQLNFSVNGVLQFVSLPSDTYIQTYYCRGEGPGTWHTAFYPDGQVKLLWCAKDQWIQGIPCREASFWTDAFGGGVGVYFHPNGKLKRCKLFQDIVLEGRLFKRGEHVEFDGNGKLVIT